MWCLPFLPNQEIKEINLLCQGPINNSVHGKTEGRKEGRKERGEGGREGERKEKRSKEKEKGRDKGREVRRWGKGRDREKGGKQGGREEKIHMPRTVRPNPMGHHPGIKSQVSRKVKTSHHVS